MLLMLFIAIVSLFMPAQLGSLFFNHFWLHTLTQPTNALRGTCRVNCCGHICGYAGSVITSLVSEIKRGHYDLPVC